MAVYFASDMHLRIDRPARSIRLARWVDTLAPSDTLYLLGDVCDFWFAARQQSLDPFSCEGLRSIADFKSRGGALTILAGNHDHWLGRFYKKTLGARFEDDAFEIEVDGIKLHLVHGHHVGGRPSWKRFMESRVFLDSFQGLPTPVANMLDTHLDKTNETKRKQDEEKLLPFYKRYASKLPADIDTVIFGHIHTPYVEELDNLRLVVLGSWHEKSCYLKIDEGVVTTYSESDSTPVVH